MANENIVMDVDGYEVLTEAIMALLNDYPGLKTGEVVKFNDLDENSGKTMFPMSGTVIEREERDIVGGVMQYCQYPFYFVYRCGKLNEARRQGVKEWLDKLGRWLEKQPVKIGDTTYVIDEYPVLTGTRKIRSMQRTSPAALNQIGPNNTEDWVISISVKYINQF